MKCYKTKKVPFLKSTITLCKENADKKIWIPRNTYRKFCLNFKGDRPIIYQWTDTAKKWVSQIYTIDFEYASSYYYCLSLHNTKWLQANVLTLHARIKWIALVPQWLPNLCHSLDSHLSFNVWQFTTHVISKNSDSAPSTVIQEA